MCSLDSNYSILVPVVCTFHNQNRSYERHRLGGISLLRRWLTDDRRKKKKGKNSGYELMLKKKISKEVSLMFTKTLIICVLVFFMKSKITFHYPFFWTRITVVFLCVTNLIYLQYWSPITLT